MKHFETALKAFIDAQTIPAERLAKAIHYTLFPGGKRFRPQLIFATGALFNLPEKSLMPLAIAIECMHTYTLVHDDLPAMDNDDLRRNRPTCHKAFDEATAILVGDALQSLAILALTPFKKTSLIHILLQASGPSGMLSGQSLDLSELSKKIPLSVLENIHHLKTTTLIQAAIEMTVSVSVIARRHSRRGNPAGLNTGLLRGCAPRNDERAVTEKKALLSFGKHLGLAFQMRDDYLDAYAPQTLGKAKSSDEANQKHTFASFYKQSALLELTHDTLKQAQKSLSVFGTRAKELEAIIEKLQM